MKFSQQWLQKYLTKEISTEALAEQLPMLGLEIDAMTPVAGDFSGVIVAQVESCEQHPNADRLSLCKVNTGSEVLSIVCGGKNVRKDLKVALATVGAVLPGNFKIKRGKIRGEESLGMLCSEVELGMAETSDGIMELPEDAPIGQNIREYLQLDDISFEVDLTPNRGDCLSLLGIAREVAAKNNCDLTLVDSSAIPATLKESFEIKVEDSKACPSYFGRVIKNINSEAKTPLWMQEHLRRSGLRPISPVVDVTNYVLLELGQPMHGFDLEKLSGEIEVRFAKEDEPIELLNEETVKLKTNTLIIASNDKPIAIAGVMGGLDSSCTDATKHIFLESALFMPATVSGVARQYGMHTDSSHRFERGVDPALQVQAIERATSLLLEIVGGEASQVFKEVSKKDLPQKTSIELSSAKLESVLGIAFEKSFVTKTLSALHMQVTETENGWNVIPPSFRYDIKEAVDLIEEVIRFYGYNNVPLVKPSNFVRPLPQKETQLIHEDLRKCLISLGFHETLSYSFLDPKIQNLLEPELKPLALKNPISPELSVMRTSVFASLLQAVAHNQKRQSNRVRLFELGKRFIPSSEGLKQEEMLAGVMTDTAMPVQWNEAERKIDFFDVKGVVEQLLSLTNNREEFQFIAATHPSLHPGQSAKLVYNNKDVGWIGAINPQIQQKLGLNGSTFVFEIAQSALMQATLPVFSALSKFPSIKRDLALIVKEEQNADAIKAVVQESAKALLVGFNIFDVYKGKGLPEGHKSIGVTLTLQDNERTLVDTEVNELMDKVINNLQEKLQARLRD